MKEKRFRLYRWSQGVVVDTFEGNEAECRAYCDRFSLYFVEWSNI